MSEEKRRLKILHIIPSFQHPKVRGPDRHYRFGRELAKRHDITLLSLIRSPIPEDVFQEVSAYTQQVLTFNASLDLNNGSQRNGKFPGQSGLRRYLGLHKGLNEMKSTFNKLVQEGSYDVVLFHGKSVFPVISDFHDLPVVIDFCDATSMRVRAKMGHTNRAKGLLLWLRYLQVRIVEQNMVNMTPHVAFISARDREAVVGSSDRFEIVSNGLDLGYWHRKTYNPKPNCLVFTGVMNYSPNEDAALYLIDEILPLLKTMIPDVEILIVGRDPTQILVERAQKHSEVTITGFIDDMRTYMEQATIFAAPIRFASGMQNKIQEALAMEVPVVTTSVVADGMRMKDEGNPPLWVADGTKAFAERIAKLLDNKTEQKRLAAEGRRFAEKHFDWSRSAEKIERMCFEALNQG